MAENVIGSLGGYVAALSNRIVPLIINAHIDRQLYETLKDLYKPEFIWGRETLLEGMPIVFSKYGLDLPERFCYLILCMMNCRCCSNFRIDRKS